MKSSDLEAIEREVDLMITSTIGLLQGPKHDIDRNFSFDPKKVFSRRRLHQELIDETKAYFTSCGLTSDYREQPQTFVVSVRLLTAHLTGKQAALFNSKMESFGRKTA